MSIFANLKTSTNFIFYQAWYVILVILSGCSNESIDTVIVDSSDPKTEQSDTEQGKPGPSSASCSFDIIVGDNLRFNVNEIVVKKTCADVSINLKHEGKLAAKMMGHNWVLTKASDVTEIAAEGISAGLVNNYLNTEDNRILAWTKIIGGGEETSISFSAERLVAGEDYTFFCSFPGHSYGMRGTLNIES